MPKIEDRIASLEGKLKELRVQQQRAEARKRAAAQRRTRADDTRRKILVGAVVLDQVARGHVKNEQLRQWLDDALVRDDDRVLFGLPQRPFPR